MHTCVLVHRPQLCPAQYATGIGWRQAIPPAWGNIAGVRSQWPLGKPEVQTVLFSALDPPPPPKIPPPQTVSHTNVWVEPLVISSSPRVRPLARARARAVWKWHARDWFCPLSRSLFYMTNSQRMSQIFQWHLAGGLLPWQPNILEATWFFSFVVLAHKTFWSIYFRSADAPPSWDKVFRYTSFRAEMWKADLPDI